MALHPKIEEEIRNYALQRSSGSVAVYQDNTSAMVIDFGNPKGGNIVFGGNFIKTDILLRDVKEEEVMLKTNLYYTLNVDEENGSEVDLDIKTIYNFNTYSVMEFSRDTTPLIADGAIRGIVQKYLKYQKCQSVLMLTKGTQTYILPTPKKIVGLVGNKNISEMTVSEQKTHEKNDLKAYETPKEILETTLRAYDYNGFKALVHYEIANRVYVLLKNSAANKKALQEITRSQSDFDNHQFISFAVSYITYKMMKAYGHPVSNRSFDDKNLTPELTPASQEAYERFHEMIFDESSEFGGEKAQKIFNYIEKIVKESKDTQNPLSLIMQNKDTYKEVIGKELSAENLVLFDPQAGSAKDLFNAADAVGMGEYFKLWGTEIRELDYGENSDRSAVIGGVNTATMASVISNAFFQKNLDTAVQSMITWNNPPYSLDDGIAKASLDMYKNGTMITGLYPVKMTKYLKNTMQNGGLIINLPAKLTGYTDPNTPERFVLVFGTKYTKEADAREHGIDEVGGVFEHATNNRVTEIKLDEDATHKDLLTIINGYFASHNLLGSKVMKNLEYFGKRDWRNENVLLKTVSKNINDIKHFYSNAEKFAKAVESNKTKELFTGTIQPLQLARTERVFLDTRFYSPTGDYTALNFAEAITNIPLLIHYIKTKPKIFEIIEKIAEENNITLPIDKEAINMELFKVGEKYTGEKVKVATDKLGMMKFNFYPTDFDVQDETSRRNMIEVIKSIYKDNNRELSQAEIEALDKTMRASVAMTTKTETIAVADKELDEYTVQTQECLVLEGDNHAVKLNISNFDLYNKLEEMGYFDINDYIEVAELQADKKEEIIKGFNEYIANVTLKDIGERTGIDVGDFNQTVEKLKAEITKEAQENGESKKLGTKETVKRLNDKLGMRDYIESYFVKTKSMEIEKIIYGVIDKHLGNEFRTDTKEGRAKLKKFVSEINGVFEVSKEVFFRSGLDEIMFNLLKTTKNKYEAEGALTNSLNADLDNRFADMMEEMKLSLGDLEKFVSETANMLERLGLTLYYIYPKLTEIEKIANAFEKNGKADEALKIYEKGYDTIFSSWARKVASLMEHQIKEPENFVGLEEARTNFMLKKMRTGKTLTFIFVGFLEMLTKKSDMELYLNSANIKDIAGQLTQHIPMLMPSIRVYAGDDKHNFIDDISFKTMYHTSAIVNPFKVSGFSEELLGGGAMQEKLANRFYQDIDMISKALDKKYPDGIDIDQMIEAYQDSPFVNMLKKAKEMCG